MPRRPPRTTPTVLLPDGSRIPPGHWQEWLAQQLRDTGREVRVPQLPHRPDAAVPDWVEAVGHGLSGLADDGFDLVAHGLGALLWLHRVAGGAAGPRPARVALVAPPAAAGAGPWAAFVPVRLDVDAVRHAADGTVLVGGDTDPQDPAGIATSYGRPLRMPTTIIDGGGHLDPQAGFGPWPAMLDWCRRDNLAFTG